MSLPADHDHESSEHSSPPQPDCFSVATTSLLSGRRLLTLKQGDLFGVFDQTGDILCGKHIADGLYYKDTRYLSGLTFSLNNHRPVLLSSGVRENNIILSVNMTNEDTLLADGTTLGNNLLHVLRSRFLWHGACFERIAIQNFDIRAIDISCEIRFFADFADLFEARGATRAQRGTMLEPEIGTDYVKLSYEGLDEKIRTTRLSFCPRPDEILTDRARFRFTVAPGEHVLIHAQAQCDPLTEVPSISAGRAFLRGAVAARREMRLLSSRATAIASSNDIFNEAIRRSICDIYMLVTEKKTGLYPAAGIPWYSTVFGRDALITGLQTLWMDPFIAKGVLFYLALHQADHIDEAADAEPGKILHEVRQGEMAELGEVPFRRYYGSVDSTPLFVMLAGEYYDRTGDINALKQLWPHIKRAIDWMDNYGDRDGDGFIEYGRRNQEGLANQGWKDSYDSIFHADGTLATGPIALCEVQAYAYAARQAATKIGYLLGEADYATQQEKHAQALRSAFNTHFWNEELGTYVLALDGKKQACNVRSSNAGHVLLTDIAPPQRVARVVATLMDRKSFSGWGIRTIPQGEARFNPMAYHNGSVWPHDNTLIAMGFAKHGYHDEARKIFTVMFDAAFYSELRRLPELFCGFSRNPDEAPVRYPVACSPQAWAAATLPALVQAILGLSYNPRTKTVLFTHPTLPDSISSLTLYNLNVSAENMTVQIHRVNHEVAIHVIERSENIMMQIRI